MRIVIITQDDPFYLAENLDYLFRKMPAHSQVVGCVVFDASPFGKKENTLQKAKRTWRIFGFPFFFRYGLKFISSKFNPDKSIRKVLKKHHIPLIGIEGSINSTQSLDTIRSYQPDLLISIAGNQIFRKLLIELAPKGCLNLHTALLPKYRGLMPTFWVLKNGETHTGVTVFFVDEGIDSGAILVQKKVEIGTKSQQQLIEHTKKIGMEAIVESIEMIARGNYSLIENRDEESTYHSFPTKEDVKEFLKKGKRFY